MASASSQSSTNTLNIIIKFGDGDDDFVEAGGFRFTYHPGRNMGKYLHLLINIPAAVSWHMNEHMDENGVVGRFSPDDIKLIIEWARRLNRSLGKGDPGSDPLLVTPV